MSLIDYISKACSTAYSKTTELLTHPMTMGIFGLAGVAAMGTAFSGAALTAEIGWMALAGTGVYEVLAIGSHARKSGIKLEHLRRIVRKLNDLNEDQIGELKDKLKTPEPNLQDKYWEPNFKEEEKGPILSDVLRALKLGKVKPQHSGLLANILGKIGDVAAPISEALLLFSVPKMIKFMAQLFAPVANDIGEHVTEQHKKHIEQHDDDLPHNGSRTAVGTTFAATAACILAGLEETPLTVPLTLYAASSVVFEWEVKRHKGWSLKQRLEHFGDKNCCDQLKSASEHLYALAAAATTAGVAMAEKQEHEGDPFLGKFLGTFAIAAGINKVSQVWNSNKTHIHEILAGPDGLAKKLGISVDEILKRENEIYYRVMQCHHDIRVTKESAQTDETRIDIIYGPNELDSTMENGHATAADTANTFGFNRSDSYRAAISKTTPTKTMVG